MSPSFTESAGHGHGLHVIIPNNESIVPQTAADNNASRSAVQPFDTPEHSHGLLVLPRPSTGAQSPNPTIMGSASHGHGLFRVPPQTASPTNPRPSARIARRSSLLASREEPRLDEATDGEMDAAEEQPLPPTSEAEEPSTAEVDGSFHIAGDSGGGNN